MLRIDPAAFFQRLRKIGPDICQHRCPVQIGSALEMVVKTPVVQVGGADGSDLSIAQALLGMTEAGSPFIDPDTLRSQTDVVRTGKGINRFFCPGYPA